MPARVKEINLLPPSEFESSFGGKFLKWAVTTGRYIIILTEIVVIAAFFSRFKLDRDVSLLSDEVSGAINVLEANSQLESDFRSTQTRTAAVGNLLTEQMKLKAVIDKLEEQSAGRVTLSTFGINPSGITLTGQSTDETNLGGFLAALALDPKWKSVEVNEIAGSRDTGIRFTLSIKK